MTPSWAGPDPDVPAAQTEMPDPAKYEAYLRGVMGRYQRLPGSG